MIGLIQRYQMICKGCGKENPLTHEQRYITDQLCMECFDKKQEEIIRELFGNSFVEIDEGESEEEDEETIH